MLIGWIFTLLWKKEKEKETAALRKEMFTMDQKWTEIDFWPSTKDPHPQTSPTQPLAEAQGDGGASELTEGWNPTRHLQSSPLHARCARTSPIL